MSFKFQEPQSRELLGGDILAQTLVRLGCTTAFGLHGGHLDAFLFGAVNAGIKLVDTRHETVSVQAAEGFSKLSGKVGVAFVTANSGFCNSLPGIATAFADRSPVFIVTSSPPLRDAETNCLQGFHDQVVLARPVSKFAHRVTNVEEIPRITSHAWRIAVSGAPGPVVVDFPIDVLFSPPRVKGISYGSITNELCLAASPNPATLDKLLDIWGAAQRPVIVVGTGAARTSDANGKDPDNTLLIQLAEATSTPVFYSSKFSPRILQTHPLRAGPAVNLAALSVMGQAQPDLLLLLGARTGFLLGGRGGAVIPNKGCSLIQVDVDGSEIGKSHAIDLGIISDSSQFIRAFLEKLQASPFPKKAHISDLWLAATSRLKHLVHEKFKAQNHTHEDGRLHPYHAINTLYRTLAPLAPIVLIDGGECGVWSLDLMESANATHSLASTGYLGFLGNGWGYALGAAEAYPDRLIVNMQGDGSAGFHIQELDTYSRHHKKILTVVVNNDVWGMSLAGQDIIYSSTESARPVSALSPRCRFELVAEGFNCESVRISEYSSIETEVQSIARKIMEQSKPGLINLLVSTQPVTETTKGMVGKPPESEASKWIVVPYYDNVLRPSYPDDEKSVANGV